MKAFFTFLTATVLFVGCTRQPEAIEYGKDACEHCKMTIMDNKYGAEILTRKGKVFKFDAAECMVDFVQANSEKLSTEDLFLTTNLAHPGSFINAREATFLKDKQFRSPMGGNLASFNSRQLAENNRQSADAEILTWEQLLKN